ncbi:Membrane transport protein [Sesbania bispinosa]|nr:Membrane transport protein [Sesbania bispinosa]
MVFFVFGPALVCGSLAETITLKSMVMLWFMPLNVLLTFIIGTALGILFVKITRVPHHLQGLVLGCCAAGRLGSVYIWTYVYNIVRVYSPKISNEVKVDDSTINPISALEIDTVTAKDRQQTNHMKQLEIECAMPDNKAEVPKKEKIIKQLKIFAEKINLKVLFAPATIGAIIGLIIGVVPEFRKLLIGDSAPLRVVQDSIVMVGDAGIPAMTILVGANLIKGLKGLGKQLPLIVGIIVVRFIALPVIGIGIVKGAVHFGLIHPDPLYQFLLLLQFALPPAVAISTITQLFGAGEGECSVIMLATYSCATVSLTLWSTFFMWLVL